MTYAAFPFSVYMNGDNTFSDNVTALILTCVTFLRKLNMENLKKIGLQALPSTLQCEEESNASPTVLQILETKPHTEL